MRRDPKLVSFLATDELNPATVIIVEVLNRRRASPVEPFVIVLSNRSRHEVPTPDHGGVQRFSRRANVDHDDGSLVTIDALRIAKIQLVALGLSPAS